MKELKLKANAIRQDIVRMLSQEDSGHTAACLGMADVFTALYFGTLKHMPRKPNWEERDRVFVSSHLNPAWHAALAHSGYFAKKNLLSVIKPEVEIGRSQALSMAIGSALAARIDGKNHNTYCVISDREHNDGQIWEAIMLAGKYKINSLITIIDRSNIQADGYTEDIMPLEPLRAKYETFNWNVIEVDGHNTEHLIEAIKEAKTIQTKPTAIIAHAIPGKGVRFVENRQEWHGKAPTKEQERIALTELNHERQSI